MTNRNQIGLLFGAAIALGAVSAGATPVLRYQADLNGSFVLTGNTLAHDCQNSVPLPTVGTLGVCGANTSDSAPDVFWRSEEPGAGQALADVGIAVADARSTAMLTLPAGATVQYARLYWGALSPTAQADTTVVFERPGVFNSGTLTADVTHTVPYNAQVLYESGVDVTSYVQQYGVGAYRVSGVDSVSLTNVSDSHPFAGWSLVVAYETATDPLRQVSLFDALDVAGTGSPVNVNITGFLVPNSGIDASLGIVAYGGDTTGGSVLTFNGTDLTDGVAATNKFFNCSRTLNGSAISNAGDLPQLTGGFGSMSSIDMDVVGITPYVPAASTSATLSMKTGSLGNLMMGVAITSITTFKPNFDDSVKSAVDVNGGILMPGDVIRYTLEVINTGNDPAAGVVLTDVLPAGVNYVPGSIVITSGANSGAKTDQPLDDQAEYTAGTRTITVRLGSLANGSVGGTMAILETATITFDVTVSGTPLGTISNQATILASGQNGAPTSSYSTQNSNGGPFTDVVVNECQTDADCPGTRPRCLLSGTVTLPNLCVKCLTSNDCSGTTPICDSTNTCVICGSDAQCAAKSATEPACQTSGALLGACTECSSTNDGLCGGAKPECLVQGLCGCSDTDGDSECGAADSGVICNGPAGICVPGCSTAPSRNDCSSTQVCSKQDGTVGSCSPQPCTTNADCPTATPICNTVPVTHVCVQCLLDSHCGTGLICDLTDNTCVQCTPTSNTCPAGGPGTACLPNGVCGCTTDTDCGGASSGRVCDTAAQVCVDGCRGTGGNGCPNPLVCTSTTSTIGTCVTCTSDAQCAVPQPRCTATNTCVQCLTFADCPSTAPVCTGGTCGPCAADTDCKDPAQPACNAALGGACTECSGTNINLCGTVKPQCLPAGVCGCSDTDGDSECGSSTSGKICNGPAGVCVDGCSLAVSRNDCPTTEYCDERTGAVGQCLTHCTGNADCTVAPNLVCDMTAIPHVCVGCVTTTDCPTGTVCENPGSRTCVGCITSADCTVAPNLVCDLINQTCVECVQTSDCPTGEVCDTTKSECVGCVTTDDCPTPLVCDTTTQLCVGCLTTADCTGNMVCNPQQQCVGCVDNTDCAEPTPVCDTGTQTCVDCTQDTDCAAPTPVCDMSKFACVGCVDGTDCAEPTPVCDTTAQVCVDCTQNTDCTAPDVCNVTTQTCVDCVTNDDCTAPAVCDPTTNQCVGCLDNTQCTSPDVCRTDTQVCVDCLTDADCTAPLVCDEPTNTCVECTTNADCGGSRTCDPATQLCVGNANVIEGGGCACSVPARSTDDRPFSALAGLALAAAAIIRRRVRRAA